MEFSNFAPSTPTFQPTLDDADLPEDDSKPDLTRADSYLLSNDWVNAEPEARSRMAEKASALQADALMAAKGGTIEMEVYRDGKKTRDQVPIHGSDGLLSQQARQYLDQSRQAMFMAAKDPDGGVMLNGFTNRLEAAPWVSQMASSDPVRAEADPDYTRFNEFISERTALDNEDKLQGLSFNEFKSWANEGQADLTKEVTDDPEMVKKFNRHVKRTTYDPTTMGDSKAVDLVDGELAINPYNFFEIDQVEAEIAAQNMPASQKRLALMDYHAKVNQTIMDGVRIFSAADAGPLEAVVNRPLVNELSAHLEAGGNGIDFLRANKERMSRSSYGVTSEIAGTLRDALIATGTGFTWLAGAAIDKLPGVSGVGEMLSTPAQLWGELGEESAQAYRNPIAFSVGSVDINRRDLTSLTGQIGSFLTLGGLGSAATKAVGLNAAKTALVEGTAKTATSFGTTLAKLTDGKLGEKTANFLVTSATDGSAYLGGVQAAGMSFGSTYDSVFKATGDDKEAYRAASIQGLSDGFGALIATSVMNRVAPGAERLLGVKPGKIAGSLIQRVRAARANTAGLAGLLEAQESLKKLSPELIKQFSKDMTASMRRTASNAGLRGIGITGDVAAEFGEEALDEALSDVIGMVIDDSKSWSAGDWGNIHDNFRDYFKAGILGALGGAMGGAKGAVGSGLKALGSDAERKAEVKRVIENEWDLIKKNVNESFSNRENLTQGHGGKAVKLAEILAAPESEISLKEKSALLVNAARFGKLTSVMASTVPIAPEPSEAAPEEDQEEAATGAAPTATGASVTQQGVELSPQDVIRKVGQIPAGRTVKDDVEVEELASSKNDKFEFIPLKIGSISHAGAKVVTTDAQGKKQVTYLNAKEAAAKAPTSTLKKAFQATVDREGKGLIPQTYAEEWSIQDNAPPASTAPQGDAVHASEAIAAEYEALSKEEIFSRAKWEKDPDSLDADNEESFRAKKRAMTEIQIRGLQAEFEQSKKSDESDQAADNVGTDSQNPSTEPEGAGVGEAADGGIDGQNDGNREAGQGASESTVPDAAAEVAETPPLRTAPTLSVFTAKLKRQNSLEWEEKARDEAESLSSNRQNYPGNDDVWMRKKDGKVFFAPGFLQRVLENPAIADPVAFVVDSVNALKEGKPLPELPSNVSPIEEVALEEKPAPFSEATESIEEIEPEAQPEEIIAELKEEEVKLEELPAEATVEEVREAAPQLTDTATLAALNAPSKESFLSWLKSFSKGLHRFGDKLWLAAKAMAIALTGISVAPQTTNREIASVAQISPAMEEVIELAVPTSAESATEFISIDFSSGIEAEFSNGVLPLPLNEVNNVEALDLNTFPKPAFVSIDVPGPPVAVSPDKIKNAPVDRLSPESTQDYISSVVPDGVVGITLPGKLAKWWLKQGNNQAVNAGVSLLGEKEASSNRIKSMLVSMGVNESPSTFPWCSAFLSWSLNQSGNPTKSLSSRSFLRLGKATTSPSFGDVAVLWNDNPATGGRYGWGGHVGFVLGETDTHVILLSGNSGDSVDVTAFLKTRVLGYRTFDNTQGLLTSRGRPKRRARSRRKGTSLSALGADTEVEPMPETNLEPRYIVLESELEQSTENGTWKRKDDVYFFTPGKGRTLNIAQGEMLELEGSPDSRLFLMSVDNGVWVFKRVELSNLASKWSDGKFEKGVDEFQKEWAQTRLGASAQRMAPLLDGLLSGNLKTGKGSPFQALFLDILRTVAPNADAPVDTKIAGADFLQAKSSVSPTSTSLTMEVDYKKLAEMLAQKIGGVDLSDPVVRPLVALEASRILAKWIDEEQIHLITLNEEKFTRKEISDLYYDVVSDPENPFHQILLDTVKERFRGKVATADLDDPNALIEEDDMYVAGSEFIRKLHQLRISGATSEMAAQQASLLNRAIREDLKTDEKPKFIKVIGELLRRYTQRLRLVLNTRWAISRLPDSQRMLLDRLNVEYLSAGLQGDVDMVRKKLFTSARNRLDLSSSDLEDTLNDVGKVYSDALTKLKNLSKEFVNIGLDDILIFKEGDGLRLLPEIEAFVSDSKDYDLASIQDALDALSDANSFQMAWMDAYFAREAMEAAELALDFNPSELLDPTRSFDPSGIMASIVKGSPRGEVETSPMVRQLRDLISDLDGQIERNQAYLSGSALRDVREMDPDKFSDRRELLQRAKMLGVPLTKESLGGERSFARLKESIETYIKSLSAHSEFRPWEGTYDPKVTPSRIEGVVEGPNLPATAWTLNSEKQGTEVVSSFAKAQQDLRDLRIERQKKIDELNLLRDVLRPNEETGDQTMAFARDIQSTPEVLRIRDQLKKAASTVDIKIAKERYRQFKNYLDAVDEYNKRVNFMTQRAIGSFDFDSKDYALYFQDTQHLPNEQRTEPRYGKKTDPSDRAVTPGDVYGHDVVLAKFSSVLGQLPGQSFPKNPPKGVSLEKQEIYRTLKRTIESNAAFLGREARKDFFIADTLQRHKNGFDRDGYNAGAGFVLDYTEDEDTGRKTYETADEAFPSFDGLDVMFSIDRKLDAQANVDPVKNLQKGLKPSKEEQNEFDLDSILNFVKYITKAERWLKHVKERAGLDDDVPLDRTQSKFVAEMDGRQTPAARAMILLDPVLKEMEEYIDALKKAFENTVANNFYYKATPGKTFLERFDFDEDGKLKVQTEISSAVKSFKVMLPFSTSSNFKIAVEATLAAQSAVSLTRRMLKEFNNLRWQENIEREAIRTIRDSAFVPDHSEFLQLRNASLDLVTARNLEFNLNFLANYPGTYRVAGAYAYEMLEQYRKVNKGSGVEPYMKMVKARLASGLQVGVVRGSAPIQKTPEQLERERQADLWSEWESNEEGLPRTVFPSRQVRSVAMEGVNPESDVLRINDLGPENQAYGVFGSGETGASLADFTSQVTGEGKSTQADQAARQQDMLNQARIKRLTTWLTLIGFHINSADGNVEDARNFRGDVLRKGMTGEGDTRDLVERGIRGMFGAVRGQTAILKSLVESFYQENPHWEIESRDYVTASTGSLGVDYGQDPTEGAERVEYEAQQGSFDPELFAVELLEFKAEFERKVIEDAKISNDNQIANALATVLRVGAAGVTNLEIDPKSKELSTGQRLILDFKDFAETYKAKNNQDLFGMDDKAISHVTPEDSEAVAKLMRRGITQGQLEVYDAALITNEDLFLTDNSFLSLLLTNLPSTRLIKGKRVPVQTLIVRPTPGQMSIGQADQIGLRLFPGKDGMPNVIYAPLTDTSRSDAQAMMQQALLVYGEQAEGETSVMRQQISDLAAKLRITLDPGFSTDTATMLWGNLGKLDLLRNQFNNQVLEMDPKDRVTFDRLLVDHVRRSSSSLAESAITEGEVKGTGFGSDVLLVSLVLTDPNYKRAFDQAYIGTDRDMDLGLPQSAIAALQTAIQQAAGFGMDHEPIEENTEADEAVGAFGVMPDPKPLIDLLDPTRMSPADLFEDTPVTPPSDSLLFNLLGGLLVSAKESNKRLMPANPDGTILRNRDANREIYEPRTTRQELDLSQDPLAAPIFGDKNKEAWGDIRNRYVGSVLNLTNPGSIGISPMSNAMNQVRVGTQTAALLAQLPSLRSDINAKVARLIGLQEMGKSKEVIRHQIELSDKTLKEIGEMLPPRLTLELEQERRLLEDGLIGLDQTLELNQIKIDQAEAVLAKEPDGSLMLKRWKKKLEKRNKQLLALRKSAKVGTAAYDQIESERLKVQSLLAEENLGSLIELSDLESKAIKQAIADQVFELATNLNDRAAGLYEMEAELVQLSLRKRLELVHSREIQGMRELMANMRYLVGQREALLETDPSGQIREGIVKELQKLVKTFNKKTARLNEAVQANLNSHLDRLGLPPRSGVSPLSIVFGDMNTVTDAELNQIARRLSPKGIVSQANSDQLLLNSLLDWSGREFKAGLAEITGIPVNKRVKKDTSENKRANLEALRRFMQNVEGKSKQEVFNLIDLMTPDIEEGAPNRLDQVIQMLVLSTAEGQALIDERTSTEAEVKAKLDAQNDILEATRENNRIRRERDLLFNKQEDTFYVGRYRHVSNQLGPDRKLLAVQVGVELVAEGMAFDPKKKLSRQAQNERDQQVAEWGNDLSRRRKFYIEKEALRRVLKRHSQDRVDQHYKKLRGQLDNFSTFDPSRMINEAMDRVRIEDAVIKSRFDRAVSDKEKAAARGVSQEALMMMLEHQKGFYTAPVVDLKNKTADELRQMQVEDRKVRRAKWQLNPRNVEDRRRLTGTLVNDGIPVVLMAVNARERLLRAFPKTITPQNINRQVNDIVLRALADHDGSGVFMQQTMSVDTKTPFASQDFNITQGQTLNAKEAGKVFSAHFVKNLGKWLDLTRDGKVNLSGTNSKKSIEFFSSLVEQLAQVYSNQGLRDRKGRLNPTGEKVKALLEKIDNGRFIDNNRAIQDLNLIGVYAEAFAELEATSIMKKLVSGLSIHDDFASLTMMKAFHHQDARVRMRFIKDHVARETAVHLQAFLEKGFDNGRSGREGGHTAREAARSIIANEAKKLKGNALDQTIGYVLAQLEGLSDNNGMGLSQALGAWIKDFSNSYNDLLQLEDAQKARWGGKTGLAKRFLWANHIELIRDIPLASRIIQIMKESGATSQYMAVTYAVKPAQQFNRDENARDVIKALREALLKSASNKKAVEDYADVIHKTLSDTYNATTLTLALMSKPQGDETTGETDEEGKPSSWKNRSIEPSRRTYTSVPMRMAYAANPNSKKPRKVKEGKWIPDPADTVSITDSAFFGGAGKREENRKKASVFRPLAINGLAAPLAVLDDSLYRLNVAPNYEILRRLTGKVMTQSGIPKVGDSMMINSATRNAENEEEDYTEEWNIAMAAIATEIENNIFNDGRIGVVNTGFSEAMTFLASTYVVRALSSVQQIWNQVLPPVALFVTKKLLTGQFQEASDFLKILSQSISSLVTRDSFRADLNDFTKRVSPFIHFRGVDGQDVARNELRSQLRYVDPKANQLIGRSKQLSGKFVKEYENLGEKALNYLIGSGERLVSRAIFAAELMSEIRRRNEGVGPKTVEELFDLKEDQIPVVANEMARIKVSDMMGQSDQSKKSLLFQSQSDSPVWSSLLKSLVRFSNHTATTSSNMTAFLPGLLVKDENNRTRQEAVENIIGTIGQNVVFHFAKVHTLVPMLFYVFYLAGGDDDDEAARKAQLVADDWLSSEGDSDLVGFGKDLVFGSQKQLFSDKKTADAAQASAMAMLTSKVGIELASGVPVLGVMAGYSPISSILARNFVNPASEELASAVTGVEVANAWYEKTRVGVQEYSGGGIENMADITAPSSVLYDMMAAPKLAYDAYPTANSFDISLYLMSELFSPARDYRSARRKEMREAAKKEEKKNRNN